MTGLVLGLAMVVTAPVSAQVKSPKWAYAFDLSARKTGEQEFTKDTKKFGFEVFRDDNTGFGVYVNQIGEIGVANDFSGIEAPLDGSEAPKWKAGYDVRARKVGEAEFSDSTKNYAMEVFYDSNAKNWIYITENGKISITPAKDSTGGSAAPQWIHALDLNVRPGGEKDWKKAKKFALEVYKDVNTGNLIYIVGETGSIAVISEDKAEMSDKKDPEWLHGLDLKCRKAGMPNFDKETNIYGVEIFRDNFTNNFILLTSKGDITVLPGAKSAKAPTDDPVAPKFTHGLDLQCRQAGENEFSPDTKVYAMEIFDEPNLNMVIYVDEVGAVSAAMKKK